MSKSPDAFRTISEVAEWLGVQAHVLRFWESKFSQVKPVKRAGGRRYYRPADMLLLGGIKKLLHDDGVTIKGVQKMIREQGVAEISSLSQPIIAEEIDNDSYDSTVVPFRSHDTIEAEALAEPEETVPEPEPVVADPVAEVEAPEIEPEPEDTAPQFDLQYEAEDVVVTEESLGLDAELVEQYGADAPEAAPAPSEPEEDEEAAVLPSFLRHRAEPSDAAEPSAEPARPVPRIVDAPDPPHEAEIAVNAGPLGLLAGLSSLTPATASRIAPLLAELRAVRERQAQARTG